MALNLKKKRLHLTHEVHVVRLVCMCVYIYIYIYIYREREREREREWGEVVRKMRIVQKKIIIMRWSKAIDL